MAYKGDGSACGSWVARASASSRRAMARRSSTASASASSASTRSASSLELFDPNLRSRLACIQHPVAEAIDDLRVIPTDVTA
ncbi:hypothetical protein [Streptomyces sp. R33]|uniref:Uncharacterized protein n=1 Tax=Streptomyces sp. R33 TaxID=3238629 RepID=A0AB39XUU1_9ACTN